MFPIERKSGTPMYDQLYEQLKKQILSLLCHNRTRQIMEQNGYSITPIPIENDGICIDTIQNLSHALLYVTPSHQFPLGSVLPISKRLKLLEWAEKSNGYIIEDDYDSELRYHNRPIPSLQSIDSSDRTIYTWVHFQNPFPRIYGLRISCFLHICWISTKEKICMQTALFPPCSN